MYWEKKIKEKYSFSIFFFDRNGRALSLSFFLIILVNHTKEKHPYKARHR